MREIKYHNGETIKVDGIHFYGCSFVAGQELLDEEMDMHEIAKSLQMVGEYDDAIRCFTNVIDWRLSQINSQVSYTGALCIGYL